jgi:hypothetical protein
VRTALSLGIVKVDVNTELRQTYLAATAEAIDAVRPGARLLALNDAQTVEVRRARSSSDALSRGAGSAG